MKKILGIVFVLFLAGCSKVDFEEEIKIKVKNNEISVNIAEITSFEWDYLRVLRPHESRSLFGEKFQQNDTSTCLWLFIKKDVIKKRFLIPRDEVECINLPTRTFLKEDSVFSIQKGKLFEQKKSTLPSRK